MGDYNKGTRVFVGGLGESIKKEDLEGEFTKYGKLNSVWVAFNPPGFAFIEFVNQYEADEACKHLNGTEVLGSKIRVEIARGRRGGRGGGSRGSSRGRGSFSRGSSGSGNGGYRRSRGYGGDRGSSYRRSRGSSGGRGRGRYSDYESRGGSSYGRERSRDGGRNSYSGGSREGYSGSRGGGRSSGYDESSRYRSRSPVAKGSFSQRSGFSNFGSTD